MTATDLFQNYFGKTAAPGYCCLSVCLPDALAAKIVAMSRTIDPLDLAADGIEDDPHITVKYGIVQEQPQQAFDLLKNSEVPEIRIGKLSVFHCPEYDVLKYEVDAPLLVEWNQIIREHLQCVDTHPEYCPHITLAYLKPGAGARYTVTTPLDGETFAAPDLVFADRAKRRTTMHLDLDNLQTSALSSDREKVAAFFAGMVYGPRILKEAGTSWVGVDLDGTLAHYRGWSGPSSIGDPIPAMLARVKRWLAAGVKIKIFTARMSGDNGTARKAIERWCLTHLGEVLPITNKKDHNCSRIWDDRGVGVTRNRGTQVKIEYAKARE